MHVLGQWLYLKLCYLSPARIKYLHFITLHFITIEDNNSNDKESTSTQIDNQQSISGFHARDQATVQQGQQSKLNIY